MGIVGTVVLTLIIFFIPQSAVQGIPTTPESQAITSTLTRLYELLDTPITKLDVTQFAEVLLDSEHYQFTDRQDEVLEHTANSTLSQQIGYLTAMQTKYTKLKVIEKQRLALEQKARAENRQITDTEWEELAGNNHGSAAPYIYYSDTNQKTELLFHSITIEGDRAVVQYDDEAALQEAVLTFVDGNWLIVNIRAIWVHF